ncbi:MAG TPA: glycosyltransferase family 4 protein [Candidatus Obscuribacterales bacterium]
MTAGSTLLQTKPVNIMFIDHTAKLSGGEIALLRLISALDRERFRVSVVLFSNGKFASELKKIGVQPIILPLDSRVLNTRRESLGAGLFLQLGIFQSVLKQIALLRDLIALRKPDIVHTNSLKSDIIGGLAARLAGVPVLWHIRDRIAPDYLPSSATKLFRLLARIVPAYLVANSNATMQTLPTGQRASVVYDGIPKPQKTGRQNRQLSTNTVGLIGRISPWKGQHIFIEAAAIVLKKRPDTRFEIIGSTMFGEEDYLRGLREQIASLGLTHAVNLVGFRDDISDALSNLSIFVHASVLPEPFGQTVLEAMAAGVPTIASDAGAIPEIVTHEETGLLVPPGDPAAMAQAILRLLDNRSFAQTIASRARQVAIERFSINMAATRMQRIYERLIEVES